MPELPEVEHVKRGLEPIVLNQRISDVEFSDKVISGKSQNKETIIKGISLEDFKINSIDYRITSIERRSKYLFFYLQKDNDERILISHLGMSGAFFVVQTLDDIAIYNYKKHWQVIFHLENGLKLVYSDIRRFGEIRNVSDLSVYPSVLEIAPEPFTDEGLVHYLKQFDIKKYQEMPIKQMILDHKVIAGCGNIYACEALFDASINPHTKSKHLTSKAREQLYESVIKVLNMGIENGGTSVSDYVHADGQRGSMQDHLKVYQQDQCSVCGSAIKRETIGGRNTHYCPNCQH
ncbi:bifunctional DNA-formamidopyrimidine glycosylase/DNA-(apurinic or apyrimidinic site) lyase [Staphylococcus canis]|uniref:Formamidopyrimidine-DNA glycosylase n=1 Tax=Staphylococcus canis TaxID=2724942 RepID=A0ABS0T6B6_9STAP|nr:bifunctional DNA-formamidopyrimidine glycosylase/DNA-(apurinic or apyrimidinic site) lyase [Staphylococcus canis]MBI5974217.1 bifunctional DNA-formamidopyrimidine glycosylase/DNA-(apurinic or apyrimidinic site) lyase [Staphylococcus canis]